MFEVPFDGRLPSTATMSTGDATKDERARGGMSDEARTAMMDVAGYTPSIAIHDCPSSADNSVRLPPSSKPGVPLAKVANELQAARQLTSKVLTILESGETTSKESEGKGDGRTSTSPLQAGTTLYPGIGNRSDKTLLDYYSARAAERRSEQPTRRQYTPPRVTMSFFPSRDKYVNESPPPAATPLPNATYEPSVAEQRPSRQQQQQQQYQPRRMQSAAGGLRAPTADSGQRGQPNVAAASTTAKSESTPKSTGLVATDAVATTEKPTPDSSRHVLKAANRKLSEPSRVATNETHLGGGGEATSRSGGRRTQNTSNGARTVVFAPSILSHLNPAPQSAKKDWGHFTLVKPTNKSQAQVDSKATVTKTKR